MSPQENSSRWVDKIPAVSARPTTEMQVLCLGRSRTATMSMHTALQILGYQAYHMKEVFAGPNIKENHMQCWREGLIAKVHGRGKPYGKEELEKILRNYSAVTDAPCVCFSDELLAAYPNAKVVLTNRDPDRWLASMETSYYRILGWRSWHALAAFDTDLLGPYTQLLRLVLMSWTGGDLESREKLRKGFIDHYDHIRAVVPRENLLEWTPQDGWDPLCNFLGKPVPKEQFPYVNKGDNAANLHKSIFWIRLVTLFASALKLPVAAVIVGWVAWMYLRR